MLCKSLLFLLLISLFVSCKFDRNYNGLSAEDSVQTKDLLAQSERLLPADKIEAERLARQALQLCENKKHPALEAESYNAIASSQRYHVKMDALFGYDRQAIQKAKESGNDKLWFTAAYHYAADLISFGMLDDAPAAIHLSDSVASLTQNDSVKSWQLYLEGLYTFRLQSNLAETEKQFQQSLTLAQRYNISYLVAWNKIWIFQTHIFRGETNYTSQLAFEALNYFEQQKDKENKAACETIIGDSYRVNGNVPKSIEYFKKAYPEAVQVKNYITATRDLTSLHYVYILNNDLSAVANTLPLLNQYADTLSSPFFTSTASNHAGRYYTYTGRYDTAASLFKTAEREAIKINSAKLVSMVYVFETEFFAKQNKAAEADSIQSKAYVMMQKVTSKELRENSYKTADDTAGTRLSEDEKLEKRLYTDSAFASSKGREAIKALRHGTDTIESRPVIAVFDSSILVTYNKELLNYETQFRTRQKDDSLRIARQEAIITNNNLHIRNALLTGVFIIAVLLAAGFYLQYKNRRRAERDKTRIEMLQNEIHHRVKNNLAVINRLIEVAGKGGVDNVSLQALQTRVKAIELLHKQLYNDSLTGNVSLQDYLLELTAAIQDMFEDEHKAITISVHAPVEVSSKTAEKIGLIVNELVTNSYKYAFDEHQSGDIRIEAQPADAHEYKLVVADNGKGFSGNKKKSYGMKLIAGLSGELGGSYAYANNGGTQFNLTFKDN